MCAHSRQLFKHLPYLQACSSDDTIITPKDRYLYKYIFTKCVILLYILLRSALSITLFFIKISIHMMNEWYFNNLMMLMMTMMMIMIRRRRKGRKRTMNTFFKGNKLSSNSLSVWYLYMTLSMKRCTLYNVSCRSDRLMESNSRTIFIVPEPSYVIL